MLSLDDVLNSPRDPELLQRHLQNLGIVPTVPPQTSEPLVPLTPPHVPSAPAGTVPFKPLTPPRAEHIPAMHSEEMPEAPAMSAPAMPMNSPLVKPMTAPTMTEAQPAAPAAPPVAGSVTFYQERLANALAANQHDSMSDHPSFLGKVGHVLGRIGNVALDTLAPGAAADIPGTDMYKAATVRNAEHNLAAAQDKDSQEKLRAAETREAEARADKLEGEGAQELVTDGAGNLAGWRDTDGKLHSFEEEGTPQVLKDIRKDWSGKEGKAENFEQALVGAIQRTLAHGLKRGIVEAAQAGDVAKVHQLQATLQATDPEGMERLYDSKARLAETQADRADKKREREEKEAEDIVRGYDKDGNEFITSKGNARDMNLQHMTKASAKEIDDAKQNYSALNDMGAKVRNLRTSAKALDQGSYEKTLIQTALRGHPDDYGTRAAIGLMSPASKQYVQDVFSLREAALALPKQTTGGSRVSEPQAQALWNTIPATGGDAKYADSQLRKFDENLTRLWKKVPGIEGQTAERPFGDESPRAGGGGNAAPKKGDVVDGYTFHGGDPNDKKNWKK